MRAKSILAMRSAFLLLFLSVCVSLSNSIHFAVTHSLNYIWFVVCTWDPRALRIDINRIKSNSAHSYALFCSVGLVYIFPFSIILMHSSIFAWPESGCWTQKKPAPTTFKLWIRGKTNDIFLPSYTTQAFNWLVKLFKQQLLSQFHESTHTYFIFL